MTDPDYFNLECCVCGMAGPSAGRPTLNFVIGGVTRRLCQGCDEPEAGTPVRTFGCNGVTYWFTRWDDVVAAAHLDDRSAFVAGVVARGDCEVWVHDPDDYALSVDEAVALLNADRAARAG